MNGTHSKGTDVSVIKSCIELKRPTAICLKRCTFFCLLEMFETMMKSMPKETKDTARNQTFVRKKSKL